MCTCSGFAVVRYSGEPEFCLGEYKSGMYLFASQELCWLARIIPSAFNCLSYLILDEFQHLFIACSNFFPAASSVFQSLKCALWGIQVLSVLSSRTAYLYRWALCGFVILQLTEAWICSSGVCKGLFKLAAQWEVLSFPLLNYIMGKWWFGGL